MLILVILSGLLFHSCIPEPLDIDGIPVVKPQIVVSTQIIPDQSLVVLLTKTFGALDAVNDSVPELFLENILLSDAIVIIHGPQGADTLLTLSNGVYGGVFIPFQENEQYTLQVISETLGEVTATTTVKPLITFEEIQADLYFDGFDDTLAQISHKLLDPEGRNWYMLNVQEIEREDIVENIINPRAYTRLLEDSNFDGASYGEVFRVVPRDYNVGDTIAVSLSNISEEYYDFVKLRLDNRFSLVEFLGEPVNYPSNVAGGKGFFNLYIPDVRFFVLE
jgi:hypothetical protein